MAIFKKKAGSLFLATLMVMATLLSSCDANNEQCQNIRCQAMLHIIGLTKCVDLVHIQTDALPLPAKCYELDLPNCTLESCEKFCHGGKCTSYDGCCCPIA
ncbi:hypothetical protein VPH35_137851 [Triticum aestivum]